MQMIESIGKLERLDSFWPWLFRIASSKTVDFFRSRTKTRTAQFSTLDDSLLAGVFRDDSQDTAGAAVRRELSERVFEAMARLEHTQRAIVSLRCFEGLSYAEIGKAVGCSRVSLHEDQG